MPHGCTVEGVSLATLFERERIETIDMLKMDIEGAEHDVLLFSAEDVLRRIRTLALEYHPNASKEVLFDALRSAGFDLVQEQWCPTLLLADFRQTGSTNAIAERRSRRRSIRQQGVVLTAPAVRRRAGRP